MRGTLSTHFLEPGGGSLEGGPGSERSLSSCGWQLAVGRWLFTLLILWYQKVGVKEKGMNMNTGWHIPTYLA